MEMPVQVLGPEASNDIRDAKVALIKSMRALDPSDVVLGQYVKSKDGKEEVCVCVYASVKCVER